MAVYSKQIKGTVSGNYGSYVNYYLDVTINSQDIVNNRFNVTLHQYAQATSTSANSYNDIDSTATLGYKNHNSGTYTYVVNGIVKMDFRNKAKVELGTWTGDIPANSDGSLQLDVIGSFDTNGPVAVKKGSLSATITDIPSIARKSSFSATNASVESNSTISITPAFSGAKHTLTYSFDGLTGTIATKTTSNSVSFTIPTSFYSKFTAKGQTKTCTITCATYSGDTLVGSSSVNITISLNESKCLPNAVINSVTDTNAVVTAITGSNQKLIKHVSNVKVVSTASANSKTGWSLSSAKVNGINTSGEVTISNVTTGTFNLAVKDNRGFENSDSKQLTIYDYVPLTASVSFKRKTQTGNEVLLSYSGNYFSGSFGTVANTLTLSWAYKEKGASSWITGGTLTPTITGNTYKGSISCGQVFDYQKSYDFIFYYSDKLSGAKSIQQSLTKGQGVIEFYQHAIKIFGKVAFYD